MRFVRPHSAAVIALIALSGPVSAGVIAGYDPALATSHERYDIYSSGFSTAPIRNASPSFLAAGLDLSAIGHVANNGLQGVTMISPQPSSPITAARAHTARR